MPKRKKADGCIKVTLTLTERLVKAIDKRTGARGRSEFIRIAAAEKLNRPSLAEVRPQGRPKEEN